MYFQQIEIKRYVALSLVFSKWFNYYHASCYNWLFYQIEIIL
jgi:hypothetical protein